MTEPWNDPDVKEFEVGLFLPSYSPLPQKEIEGLFRECVDVIIKNTVQRGALPFRIDVHTQHVRSPIHVYPPREHHVEALIMKAYSKEGYFV
jgi:hypothetical protein